jgi:addiction module HigA family antidote
MVRIPTHRRPTHPGEALREDVIKPLGLTVAEAARRLGVEQETLADLLDCKTRMSAEMAVRVGKATNTTPVSWLTMQTRLDLWLAEQDPPEVESLGPPRRGR